MPIWERLSKLAGTINLGEIMIEPTSAIKNYYKVIFPIVIGVLGYFVIMTIVSVLFGFISQTIWDPLILYNRNLSNNLAYIKSLLFFSASALLGYLTIRMIGSDIKNKNEAFSVGILTGIAIGIPYAYYNIVIPFFLYLTPDSRGRIYYVFLSLLVGLFSILIIEVGTTLFTYRELRVKSEGTGQEKSGKFSRVLILIFFSLVFLLVIIPIAVLGGIWAGWISFAPNYPCHKDNDYVDIFRPNNDSIIITQLPPIQNCNMSISVSNWLPRPKKFENPTWQIYLNRKDISNASMIQRQNISLTISPPEGLVYGQGSSVRIAGSEVKQNRLNTCRMRVVEHFNGTHSWFLNDFVTEEDVKWCGGM